MKLIVCGSRTIAKPQYIFHVLDTYRPYLQESLDLLIHGAANGADTIAAQWAKTRNVPSLAVPADWKRNVHGPGTYDRSAGPKRNTKMLEMLTLDPDLTGQTDEVIAFVDKPEKESRGTAHMLSIAESAGFTVHVFDTSTHRRIR